MTEPFLLLEGFGSLRARRHVLESLPDLTELLHDAFVQ